MAKFATVLAVCLVALAVASASPVRKVNLALQKTLKSKTNVNIIVTMADSTASVLDQVSLTTFANRGDQATAVFRALSAHAADSQKNVLALLNSPRFFATKVQSFWISNQILVESADQSLIEALAAMDDVLSVDEEVIVRLDETPVQEPADATILAEWNIEKVKAPAVWQAWTDGTGGVVAIIDTGARSTHEAIRGSYAGNSHSWYDPYSQTQAPGDGHGHGTHVTGTVAGSLGIGVAPGVKWISCKGLQDNGSGSQSALLACGQFVTCPHSSNGGNPDCTLAPHAVSNSWGGGSGANWYDPVIRAWHAANVVPLFAHGNSGSACSTSGSPGDSVAGVIAVGSTTETDAIASFSSRGPSSFGQQKPDLTAPGATIRSASHVSDTAYATMSGSSMACPHVAGAVGLMKALRPNSSYATVKEILEQTAERDLSFGSQVCGGKPENEFPNYIFGHGRLDAFAAVNELCKQGC